MDVIEVDKYLPEFLATPMKQYAAMLGVEQSSLLTTVLVAASSFHSPENKFTLTKDIDSDSIVPTLYGCLVGESGVKKTPVVQVTIDHPFRIILQGEDDLYETVEDSPAPWYYRNCSRVTNKLLQQKSVNFPHKSFMLNADEWILRLLSKLDLFTYYCGRINSNLEDESNLIYLSIMGTIFPSMLTKIVKSKKVDFFVLSKFIFVIQHQCDRHRIPIPVERDDDSRIINLPAVLAGVYYDILHLPKFSTGLGLKAYKVYREFYKESIHNKVQSSHLAEKYFWEESPGLCRRLAFNLHILDNLVSPGKEVSQLTMEKSIELVRFYHEQLTIVLDNACIRN